MTCAFNCMLIIFMLGTLLLTHIEEEIDMSIVMYMQIYTKQNDKTIFLVCVTCLTSGRFVNFLFVNISKLVHQNNTSISAHQ
jgi:hypothetical protein